MSAEYANPPGQMGGEVQALILVGSSRIVIHQRDHDHGIVQNTKCQYQISTKDRSVDKNEVWPKVDRMHPSRRESGRAKERGFSP